MRAVRVLIVAAVLLSVYGRLWGAAVIDEPFADSEPSLNGNTPGLGLTNTWAATSTFKVEAGNLAYGAFPRSDNQVVYGDGGLSGSSFGNAASSVDTDGSLGAAGLLDDGTNLWFSILIKTPVQGGSNPDTGFAIGTDQLGSGNNIPMPSGGQGIGWSIKNDRLRAATWNNAISRDAGFSVSRNTSMLIVGEVIWGATPASDDTINLYLPNLDLQLPASPVSTRSAALNQANFDKVTSSLKNNQGYEYDQIRFGATYDDVVPVPAGPPEIASLNPTNEATNVSRSTSLTATFSKPVQLTGSGTVTVTNLMLSAAEVISLPDVRVTLTDYAFLTVSPAAGLSTGTHYAVLISADAIEDLDSQAFAGISDPDTWDFITTADATPPTIASTDPADGGAVGIFTDVKAMFSEGIQFTGGGSITLRNVTLANDTTVYTLPHGSVSISGSELTISPTVRRDASTTYAILISSNAVEDLGGNAFAGIDDETAWDFTTLDTVNYEWTGAVDGDWNNSSNWNANGVPVDTRAGAVLDLDGTSGERIVFDAPLSANPVPTSNIPSLGGYPTGNPRIYITPQLDVANGTLVFSAPGFNNQGFVRHNTNPWTTTVGDGDTENGLASLTYNGGFSQGINRDPGGEMVWTINADGEIIVDGSGTTLVFAYEDVRPANFILNGGSFTTPDALDMLRNFTTYGNSYIEFTDAAGTFTAAFGVDFLDVDAVNAQCGPGLVFRSTLGVDPVATDNMDGTFTVAVPAPDRGTTLLVR